MVVRSPNGVSTTDFNPSAACVQPGLVLCVNRYTPLKGGDVFVRAAALVQAEFPHARFRMVGRSGDWDGEAAENHLCNLAESLGLTAGRFELAGPRNRQELPSEYASAETACDPSFYESYSYTTAEALASGRPTIITDAQGIAEYLSDGDNVLIVPARDVDALAEAMRQLLRDESLRRHMGAAARRTVETSLSSDVVVAQLEAAYRAGLRAQAARVVPAHAQIHIAILTHNALDYTQRCLASLAAHTPVPHQIFIVDNASTDATPEWLSALMAPHIHVDLSPDNLGVAGGRNRLLKTILPHLPEDGQIVFLDNDVEVHAGRYRPFIDLFRERPDAGVAGAHGHPFIVCGDDRRELLPAPEIGPTPVDVVTGFCFWINSGAARTVGLFDHRLGNFWHEDDDYCVRALAAGWEVYALPNAPLTHTTNTVPASLNPT